MLHPWRADTQVRPYFYPIPPSTGTQAAPNPTQYGAIHRARLIAPVSGVRARVDP
ncbi:MAG: hypothetical protein RBU37_24825 [Myxococcota bacterium]|nr:hypothetical protein [Myxococcota bacterium]